MTAISIPNPCNQNWNNMHPAEQGRFCKACAKTVIDFTVMNDEEVKHFFLHKKDEKICGKIRNDQVYRHRIDLPENIFAISMPYWKRFLAACLVVFSTTLFSCETSFNNKGEIVQLIGDTVMVTHFIDPPLMGDTTYQMDNLQPTFRLCSETKGDIETVTIDSSEQETMGVLLTELKNSIRTFPVEQVLKKDSLVADPVDTIRSPLTREAKNPPKADSINCGSIPVIYS